MKSLCSDVVTQEDILTVRPVLHWSISVPLWGSVKDGKVSDMRFRQLVVPSIRRNYKSLW